MPDLLNHLKAALADRYRVDREIGRGGMAHVFLAHDLKLDRPVALKVLRPDLAAVLGGDRFLREITLAAKLEHPHILGIYDSGEADGILYYVMPFVEGESLRDRLTREKQLPVDEALQISREVADALSYAHARGVIHRDIKPENILLRAGHAVVADFGIARAVDAAGGARLTETGVTLGTPTYMSPEQVAGSEDLDGRSDLYALGCVLYEMLAGQPPFTGPTIESMVAQHLSAPPPDVATIRPSVPSWVGAALQRSLAKTPADRFNPVAQFAEAIALRASPTHAGWVPAPTPASRRRLVPGILVIALIVVITLVVARMLAPRPLTVTASNITRVTREPGVEFQPAISPDGEEVVHTVGPIESSRIVVRSTRIVGSGGEIRPGADVGGSLSLPAWTPDGASLRFYAERGGQTDWMEVPKLGGTARTVFRPVAGGDFNILSPDGTRVVALRGDSIFAYAADDGEPSLLAVPVTNSFGVHSFAWSPDGRWIAYVNGNAPWRAGVNVMPTSIWLLDAHDGGDPVRVTDETAMDVSPQWLDGRHLLFVSDRDGPRGIYAVEVGPDGPRGAPRPVLASSDPHSISVSADGRRLAYAKFGVEQNIWAVPIPRSGSVSIRDAAPVTTDNQVIESHDVSPDGEWMVFDSDIRGDHAIYRQRIAGGPPEAVASVEGHDAFDPRWSPDGTEIVFYAGRSDSSGTTTATTFVAPADGSAPPEQLADFPGINNFADWAPDGLAIAFHSKGPLGTDAFKVWTVTRDSVGGRWSAPVLLTDFACVFPSWAPDGASLVCKESGGEVLRVSRGGDVIARYRWPAGLRNEFMDGPEFSRDGSAIYIVATHEDGSRGLWWFPAGGGDPAEVVAFDDPGTYAPGPFSVGPDRIYLTIAEYESDIWVMDLEW
jgi:eukaryotic-like serine/threonine-protein kinase